MAVKSYTHNECKPGDPPHFIVQMKNRELTTKRLDVTFFNGEGRTRNLFKARRFSEEFGYDVLLPTGHEGWETAENILPRGEEYEREEPVVLIDD